MISERTIAAAEDILGCCSREIIPIAGTSVFSLVNSLTSINETGSNKEIHHTSMFGGTISGAHTRLQDEVITQIANIMRTTIDLATNMVNPLAEKILNEVKAGQAIADQQRLSLLGKVTQVSMPELFTDQMLCTMIEPCRNSATDIVEKSGALYSLMESEFTTEELNLLLVTGSTTLDEKVAKYLSAYSVHDIDHSDFKFSRMYLPQAVMTFFMFNGLLNRPFDKCNAVLDVKDNVVTATKCKMAAGGNIYAKLNLFDGIIARGDIVAFDNYGAEPLDTSNGLREIFVLTQNYLPWIKKGGSPEAILGYHGANKNRITTISMNQELLANPEKWKQEYEKAKNHAGQLSILETGKIVRLTTRRVMLEYISALVDVDKRPMEIKLETVLSELDYFGETDNYHYVIKVITKTLLKIDTVLRLLLLVDNYVKTENNMDAAIYLAIKEVLAEWIVSQVMVK